MDAFIICERLLCQLKASGLNYSLTETPFSVNITLKKSFVRNKSGATKFPVDSTPVPQNLDLQNPVTVSDPDLNSTSQITCCKSQALRQQDMTTTSSVTSQHLLTTFSSSNQALEDTFTHTDQQAMIATSPLKQQARDTNNLNQIINPYTLHTMEKNSLIMKARCDTSFSTSPPRSQTKVSTFIFPNKQTIDLNTTPLNKQTKDSDPTPLSKQNIDLDNTPLNSKQTKDLNTTPLNNKQTKEHNTTLSTGRSGTWTPPLSTSRPYTWTAHLSTASRPRTSTPPLSTSRSETWTTPLSTCRP